MKESVHRTKRLDPQSELHLDPGLNNPRWATLVTCREAGIALEGFRRIQTRHVYHPARILIAALDIRAELLRLLERGAIPCMIPHEFDQHRLMTSNEKQDMREGAIHEHEDASFQPSTSEAIESSTLTSGGHEIPGSSLLSLATSPSPYSQLPTV